MGYTFYLSVRTVNTQLKSKMRCLFDSDSHTSCLDQQISGVRGAVFKIH